MFKDLGNFGLVRSRSQAIGFYLAYLALLLVIAMIVGMAVGLTLPANSDFYNQGVGIGAVFSALACPFLSYMVLKKKNMLGSFSSFVYIVAAAGLGLLAGILGMIIPAYLTTKSAAGNSFDSGTL